MGAPAALADEISYQTFSLEARTAGGLQGFFLVNINDGFYDPQAGVYQWNNDQNIEIRDVFSQQLIATLTQADVFYALGGPAGAGPPQDPQVSLNFAVQAGVADTEITVTSALLSFDDPISNAEGRASAAMTLSDVTGNGAMTTGLLDDGNSYTAQYNGLAPGGTQFASFFDVVEAAPFGANNVDSEFPGGGNFSPIGVDVNNMSAQWHFNLSALDIASGTSNWEIIPAPAALAVFGMAGLLGTRRRRV